MNERITPRTYLWTLVALVALAALSFGLSCVPLGPWEIVVAMVIAVAKAMLVALFFMHLVELRVSDRVAIVTAVAFVAILLGLIALDVTTRMPAVVHAAVTG